MGDKIGSFLRNIAFKLEVPLLFLSGSAIAIKTSLINFRQASLQIFWYCTSLIDIDSNSKDMYLSPIDILQRSSDLMIQTCQDS